MDHSDLTDVQVECILRAMEFMGYKDRALEDCDICEDGAVWMGLVEIMPRGSIMPDVEPELDELNEPDVQDEPAPEDFTMTPAGPLGGMIAVGRIEGKFVGMFNTEDEAYDRIKQIMQDEQYWPNVWFVSDHGNWNIYSDCGD